MSGEKPSNRDNIVRWAVAMLEAQRDFQSIRVLGQGTFGDVRLMYDPERKSAIAVKIVTSGFLSKTELELWPILDNPNVVPLLEVVTNTALNVAIFMMPVQKLSLDDVLWEKKFLDHCDAVDEVKKWLHHILSGLEYLHKNNLCHLDLKVDNVLISKASVAMLCDFTFVNRTTKPLKRRELGLPYIFRPPELCPTMGDDIAVDGESYDMWSFGLMSLEIFTHFQLAIRHQENNWWIKDIYPTMFDILQVDTFFVLMSSTFIGSKLKKFDANEALNFIHGFLKVDSSKRASATKAAQHPFLKQVFILGPPPDVIWIRKIQSDENCGKFKERCLKNCSSKDENVSTEEDIPDSEIEDMDYEESDGGFKGSTENETAFKSVVEKTMVSNTPNVKKLNPRCGILKINMENIARYMKEKYSSFHSDLKEAEMLSKDTGSMAVVGCCMKATLFGEDSKPDIGDPLLQDLDFKTSDENKNGKNEMGGSSKKLGRRRKLVQWISNKYAELVNRPPHKKKNI